MASEPDQRTDPPPPDKQAVLVIHGVGEQRPMATLRGFVAALWTRNPGAHHPHGVATLWSKPDTVSGSFELRRLTTGRNPAGVRTDFFELYWAHLMRGTTLSQVTAWAKLLLLRPPWTVPAALRGVWWVLVLLALAIGLLMAVAALGPAGLGVPRWVGVVGGALLSWVLRSIVRDIIGDAARYLDAAPDNVASRQAIRARGVEVLKQLHESGEYRRIVVVGHSLGSVIGYDLLTHAWALYNAHPDRGRGAMPALDQLEHLARTAPAPTPDEASSNTASDASTPPEGPLNGWREAWHSGQRALFEEQARRGNRWLVTDFVTCGSPLAHAALLLADDLADLRRKQEERELPTCPPTLEPPAGRFSYPADNRSRTLHHAALFGPTRWTNLYFPARWLIRGDLIGGPLAPVFGPGIRDVAVATRQLAGCFSHTRYWTVDGANEVGAHVEALQEALDLVDEGRRIGAGGSEQAEPPETRTQQAAGVETTLEEGDGSRRKNSERGPARTGRQRSKPLTAKGGSGEAEARRAADGGAPREVSTIAGTPRGRKSTPPANDGADEQTGEPAEPGPQRRGRRARPDGSEPTGDTS